MDTVILPSTEASALGDGVLPPRSAGYERGVGDSAFRGVEAPPLAHHSYSDGIILPGRCWQCSKALFEHEGEA
jgi:hypothetical protein